MREQTTSLVADTGGPRARITDPLTSHIAAEGSDLVGSQDVVYRVLDYAGVHGLTDEEILEGARFNFGLVTQHTYTGSRLRTARSELVARGVVVDGGTTRTTVTGYQARVWMLARFEEGEAA